MSVTSLKLPDELKERIQSLVTGTGRTAHGSMVELILEDHPLIGRPAEDGRRELVMGRRSEAYVALYRWLPAEDAVLILAIRLSKEAGYFNV